MVAQRALVWAPIRRVPFGASPCAADFAMLVWEVCSRLLSQQLQHSKSTLNFVSFRNDAKIMVCSDEGVV